MAKILGKTCKSANVTEKAVAKNLMRMGKKEDGTMAVSVFWW